MAGASLPHTRIKDNLARMLNNQLEGGPCFAATSDLRVKVSATGLYTYPDAVVICDEPEFEDADVDTLLNPRVIIEVLSESTAGYDQGRKYRHYQRIESLQEYILVAQDEPAVERRVRKSRWDWLTTTITGLDGEFDLVTVPAKLPMAEVYAGVTFPTRRHTRRPAVRGDGDHDSSESSAGAKPMTVSSRTPEGEPHICPVCGNAAAVEPSYPAAIRAAQVVAICSGGSATA